MVRETDRARDDLKCVEGRKTEIKPNQTIPNIQLAKFHLDKKMYLRLSKNSYNIVRVIFPFTVYKLVSGNVCLSEKR